MDGWICTSVHGPLHKDFSLPSYPCTSTFTVYMIWMVQLSSVKDIYHTLTFQLIPESGPILKRETIIFWKMIDALSYYDMYKKCLIHPPFNHLIHTLLDLLLLLLGYAWFLQGVPEKTFFQNCPNCPDLPRTAQKKPKLLRIVQNAQNCPD